MSLFRCPVCGAPLERESGAYRCPNRHSYDLAREGYTYLLPPNQTHSAAPGDDKEMSAARRALADGAVDQLLDCFSPLALEEFRRVLSPGGTFLYVVPAADHLWQLKEVLYDHPYPNEEKETPYAGFAYETIVPVDADITLPCGEDIQNLFRMTPYCWKTPKSGVERLAQLTELTVRTAFRIHVFRKL